MLHRYRWSVLDWLQYGDNVHRLFCICFLWVSMSSKYVECVVVSCANQFLDTWT